MRPRCRPGPRQQGPGKQCPDLRLFFFDDGNGWLKYTFVRRSEDPQITVEQLFWQGFKQDEVPHRQ
jgi:hypothetical protein